jgi:hypothetical protein
MNEQLFGRWLVLTKKGSSRFRSTAQDASAMQQESVLQGIPLGICFWLMKVISYMISQEFVFGFDLVRQLCSHPSRLSSVHRALVAIQKKRDEAAYGLFPSFH